MKPTRRWMLTVLAESAAALPPLPWQRGARRAAKAPLPTPVQRAPAALRS
jgi:hypothetical protein